MSYRTSPFTIYQCAFCEVTQETQRLEIVKFATPHEEAPCSLKGHKIWRYRHICVTCGGKVISIANMMKEALKDNEKH